MDKINVVDIQGNSNQISSELADCCPYCHKGIHPTAVYSCKGTDSRIQIVMKCTFLDCKKLFVGIFLKQSDGIYRLDKILWGNKMKPDINETIKAVSADFCKIYTESFQADQDHLYEICGAGYRKALEFLIKDYLIKLEPNKKSEIEKAFLGNCINDFVKNENIKAVAKRAAWLGNDEIHYVRKWEGFNLQYLKNLIELTMEWIKMEELTKKLQEEMPDGNTKSETVENAKSMTEET